MYLRVNLLGPVPRLIKKGFTGPRSHKGWETMVYLITCIYLVTCTRNGLSDYSPRLHLPDYLHTKLSDYLYATATIWLPAHDRVYLITCTRLEHSDNLQTTVSSWLPEHELVYLITCTRQRQSDYPQMKVLADYLYTNGPISVSMGFSPWLRKPSALVTLNMYTLVSLMTPGLCQ